MEQIMEKLNFSFLSKRRYFTALVDYHVNSNCWLDLGVYSLIRVVALLGMIAFSERGENQPGELQRQLPAGDGSQSFLSI